MPVHRPVPPGNVTGALVPGLREFAPAGDPVLSLPPEAWAPVKVFTLGIVDVLGESALASAKPAGWRFFAADGSAAVDIVEPADGGRPRMISLLHDPTISTAIEAIGTIEGMAQWEGHDYELRLLRIPGILVEAVWLFSAEEPDWLLPILRRAKALKTLWPYTVDEYFKICQSASERCLEFDQPYAN